jgi:hypothetical protein
LNRIAVEELEAWFFGDIEALRAVYPKLSATLGRGLLKLIEVRPVVVAPEAADA